MLKREPYLYLTGLHNHLDHIQRYLARKMLTYHFHGHELPFQDRRLPNCVGNFSLLVFIFELVFFYIFIYLYYVFNFQ